MPAGKKKVQSSPNKGNPTTTRSKTKQQKQQREIEYLALLNSPVVSRKLNPKKLSTVNKDQNQATVDLQEREKETIAQVVMVTK